MPKVSFSAEKQIKKSLFRENQNLNNVAMSSESSQFLHKPINEIAESNKASPLIKGTFSPRKALDFTNKSQGFKGRNLFEDTYL